MSSDTQRGLPSVTHLRVHQRKSYFAVIIKLSDLWLETQPTATQIQEFCDFWFWKTVVHIHKSNNHRAQK